MTISTQRILAALDAMWTHDAEAAKWMAGIVEAELLDMVVCVGGEQYRETRGALRAWLRARSHQQPVASSVTLAGPCGRRIVLDVPAAVAGELAHAPVKVTCVEPSP